MRLRLFVRPALLALAWFGFVNCGGGGDGDGDDDGGSGGTAGTAGSAGTGGTAGTAGAAGTAGTGGSAGDSGVDSSAGTGGEAGNDGGDGGFTCTVSSCASSRCEVDNDCAQCLSDTECRGGRLCSSGQCLAACQAPGDCPTGWDCCSGRCVDPANDYQNCRECGTACSGEQACGASGCVATGFDSLCSIPRITLMFDNQIFDDEETRRLRDVLTTRCTSSTVMAESQNTSDAISEGSGRPVTGAGEVLIAVGGPAVQNVVRYLEAAEVTRVYNVFEGSTARLIRRSNDGGADVPILETPLSQLTSGHSYFLIESVFDTASKTWVIEIYGLNEYGTRAGVWFFINRVHTTPASYSKRYYVYEWTSASGPGSVDGGTVEPGATDTFTERGSGP